MSLQVHEVDLNSTSGAVDRISTGSVVKLQAEDDASEEWVVTIVATHRADPDINYLSDECPIGAALLGRVAGDIVVVDVPAGTVNYRIMSISQEETQDEVSS